MRRLLLGFAAFSFLALVGVQAAHAHAASAVEHCQLCVLGAQAVRHAPVAASAPVPAPTWTPVAARAEAAPILALSDESSARAPPSR